MRTWSFYIATLSFVAGGVLIGDMGLALLAYGFLFIADDLISAIREQKRS
jgi:hypothetical protein